MVRKQIPDRGDIYHVNLSPSAGREQAKPHWVVIVSGRDYNAVSGLPFAAPISTIANASRMGGFAVNLTGAGMAVAGVVQVDQIKPIDLQARGAVREKETMPDFIMDEIIERFGVIFGLAPFTEE